MPWWQELEIQNAGVGGQGTLIAVKSATRPAATGSILVVNGPFPTRAAALGFTPGTKEPKGASTTGQGGLPDPLTPLKDVGDFFHRLTEANTWIRVGEIGLGAILVYAGLRAMTRGSTVAGSGARSAVTKPVKKAGKAVASVAVPEARLASRTVAKRAAPKTTARVQAHRQRVRQYGAKKPYQAPKPRQPIKHEVVRTSHIIHHKAG